MRLIDADKLKEYLDKKYSFGIDLKFMLLDEIDNQPTAYDIDKVVEELKNLNTKAIDRYKGGVFGNWEGTDYFVNKHEAIEIIKQGGRR